MSDQYFVYILRCSNLSLYTGYTTDLAKRYKSHQEGTGGCKYTKSFKPVSIAQAWKISGTKAFAMEIERKIKKLSRQEKEKLILEPTLLVDDKQIKPFSLHTDDAGSTSSLNDSSQ